MYASGSPQSWYSFICLLLHADGCVIKVGGSILATVFKCPRGRSNSIVPKLEPALRPDLVRPKVWRMGNLAMSDQTVSVEMVKDANGLDKLVLKEPRGASAQVYLFGGHVTSWKNDRGEELLFVSSKAIFKPPKAIRGGIPICFPQFGSCGSLEQHGFARNRFWSIDSSPPPLQANNFNNKAVVDLILKPTEEDLKIWPHWYQSANLDVIVCMD